MRLTTWYAVMAALVALATCISVDITPKPQGGITWTVKDDGFSIVGLHYSINKPVVDVAAADHNVDLNSASKVGDEFIYDDPSVVLQPGDTINYWAVYIDSDTNQGHNLLSQHYTYTGPATTPPVSNTNAPNTKAPVTNAPVTNAPVTNAPVTNAPVTNAPATNAPVTNAPVTNAPATGSPSNLGGTSTNNGGSGSGGSCACQGNKYDKTASCTSYPCLIFDEEFNEFDVNLWQHEITAGGGGNWEFQYYTNNRSNSYVRDGTLYIKPTLTSERYGEGFLYTGDLNLWGSTPADLCTANLWWGCQRLGQGGQVINPIQSARLRTSSAFNFRYGRLEVEAKMPSGDWIWPAIWLLPRYHSYGSWPVSGEIDLVEARGNLDLKDDQGVNNGAQMMGSTLHFGPFVEANQYIKAHATHVLQSGTFADSFHKYRMDWDENGMTFWVDGIEILKVDPGDQGFWGLGEYEQMGAGHFDNPWAGRGKMAPFDQEFYLILNVAVGGTAFFPDHLHNSPSPKPWKDKSGHAATDFWNARNNWLPTWNLDKNNGEDAAMQVNYVKVWKLKPDP